MEKGFVITIGREFGSGGREIGQKLAEHFGIGYYDKELLQEIRKESGLSTDFISETDEQPQGVWAHALSGFWYDGRYAQEQIFKFQSEAIRKLAEERSCVIVGRCADYILRDHPSCTNIFIHAPLEFCMERLRKNDQIPVEKARELILKVNKKRAAYYNFYTDKKWGSIGSYHLTIDSSVLDMDPTVKIIADFVSRRLTL